MATPPERRRRPVDLDPRAARLLRGHRRARIPRRRGRDHLPPSAPARRAGPPNRGADARPQVPSFDELAEQLIPAARGCAGRPTRRDPEKLDAIWCALDTRGKGTARCSGSRPPSSRRTKRGPMLVHRPQLLLAPARRMGDAGRVDLEAALAALLPPLRRERTTTTRSRASRSSWTATPARSGSASGSGSRCETSSRRSSFRSIPAAGVRARRRGATAGCVARPRASAAAGSQADPDPERRPLPAAGRPFALSATYDLPGFAVSYAFETSNRATLDRAKQAFTDLPTTSGTTSRVASTW